jgi:hypothetical protein
MTPSKINPFDKHSLHHKKWLTKITCEDLGRPIYFVWLTDTSDGDADKMLTNSNGRIIAARKPSILIDHILKTRSKLFDSRQTRAWAKKVKGVKPKSAALYDLDGINSLAKRIDPAGLEQVCNFINLFTDLITTTKADKLERLTRTKEIKAIWEHYYNYVFWPRFNDVKNLKTLKVKPFKADLKLRETLQRMSKELIQRIEIV